MLNGPLRGRASAPPQHQERHSLQRFNGRISTSHIPIVYADSLVMIDEAVSTEEMKTTF
jgi:hypothetical protein